MFWIGLGVGASLSTFIILIGLTIMMKSVGRDNDKQREKLYGFWETSNGNQEEQIQVLKDVANQIRG